MRGLSHHEEQRVHELILGMICDAYGEGAALHCGQPPTWAPRVLVPDKLLSFEPIRIMTTLHYCDSHGFAFNVWDYLNDAMKTKIEMAARQKRGPDFRCEFEHAKVERVRLNTPEYRAFLSQMVRQPA
jgi:hypothetical protein